MPTTDPKTFAEAARRMMASAPIVTTDNCRTLQAQAYTWRFQSLTDWSPPCPEPMPPSPAGSTDAQREEFVPAETLHNALARLSRLESAVAPVAAMFQEYLDDSFLPDEAPVVIDELPTRRLTHADLRRFLAAVGDDAEGAAA